MLPSAESNDVAGLPSASGGNGGTSSTGPASRGIVGVLCPYCAAVSSDFKRCQACGGFFDPLSRQATQNDMGPWFLFDRDHPTRPGCSFDKIRQLAKSGRIGPGTIIRGPTTKQFWTFASRAPSVANLIGMCHNCQAKVDAEAFSCRSCNAAFTPETDRQHLGLAPIHMIPGQQSPGIVAAAALSGGGFRTENPATVLSQSRVERDAPVAEDRPVVQAAQREPVATRASTSAAPWALGVLVIIGLGAAVWWSLGRSAGTDPSVMVGDAGQSSLLPVLPASPLANHPSATEPTTPQELAPAASSGSTKNEASQAAKPETTQTPVQPTPIQTLESAVASQSSPKPASPQSTTSPPPEAAPPATPPQTTPAVTVVKPSESDSPSSATPPATPPSSLTEAAPTTPVTTPESKPASVSDPSAEKTAIVRALLNLPSDRRGSTPALTESQLKVLGPEWTEAISLWRERQRWRALPMPQRSPGS